jgi:two-component system nitrate/nitrite response regulator NarL
MTAILSGHQKNTAPTATIMVVMPAGLFRDAIQLALRSQGHTVIGKCEFVDEIIVSLDPRSPPDLLVVGGYGSEHSAELGSSIRMLRLRIPTAKWIVAGPRLDFTLLREALEAGADGLMLDDSPTEVLLMLTNLVLLGHGYIPTPLARILSDSPKGSEHNVLDGVALSLRDDEGEPEFHIRHRGAFSPESGRRRVTTSSNDAQSILLRHEVEILNCLALGQSNNQIAEQLDMPIFQVKKRIRALFRKMRVSNRTQAAMIALKYRAGNPERHPN